MEFYEQIQGKTQISEREEDFLHSGRTRTGVSVRQADCGVGKI